MRLLRQRIRKTGAQFVAGVGMPVVPWHRSAQKTVDVFRDFEIGVCFRIEFRRARGIARGLCGLWQSRRSGFLPVLKSREPLAAIGAAAHLAFKLISLISLAFSAISP
jgi:hypothetical protein